MPIYVPVDKKEIKQRITDKLGDEAADSFKAHKDNTFSVTIAGKSRLVTGTKLESIASMLALAEMTPNDAENPTAWTIRFGFVQGLN
jgi:hypothetical protein